MASPLLAPLMVWLGRLSYPRMFVVAAILFVVNLFLPDPIPFLDELLLGLGTLLLANFKNRKKKDVPPPIDGDSPRP